MPEIAAAKAGIMKPECEAFTVEQPSDAMETLQHVANKIKVIKFLFILIKVIFILFEICYIIVINQNYFFW